MERLRGQIAFDQRRGSDAARLLLRAARLLEPLDAGLARETHLEAIWAAMFAGDLGGPAACGRQPRPRAPRRPVPARRVRSTSCSTRSRLRFTEGYAAAAPALTQALRAASRAGRRRRRSPPLALR